MQCGGQRADTLLLRASFGLFAFCFLCFFVVSRNPRGEESGKDACLRFLLNCSLFLSFSRLRSVSTFIHTLYVRHKQQRYIVLYVRVRKQERLQQCSLHVYFHVFYFMIEVPPAERDHPLLCPVWHGPGGYVLVACPYEREKIMPCTAPKGACRTPKMSTA